MVFTDADAVEVERGDHPFSEGKAIVAVGMVDSTDDAGGACYAAEQAVGREAQERLGSVRARRGGRGSDDALWAEDIVRVDDGDGMVPETVVFHYE